MASVRVVEQAAYLRSSEMVGEGGPKALSLDTAGRVVVLAGEHLPVSFYAVESFTGRPPGPPVVSPVQAASEAARLGVMREARRAVALAEERDEVVARLAEREDYVKVLEKLVQGLRQRLHQADQSR